MKIFQKQKQHQDDLTQSVNKKLDRANRHGLHLFQEFEHFEDSKHHGNHQVNFLTAGKDVHRLQLVEAKTSALDDSSFANTSSNIHRDMQFLKEHTKAYVDAKKFNAISKYNWFIIALLRLRDYLKRMNNNNNALPPTMSKAIPVTITITMAAKVPINKVEVLVVEISPHLANLRNIPMQRLTLPMWIRVKSR